MDPRFITIPCFSNRVIRGVGVPREFTDFGKRPSIISTKIIHNVFERVFGKPIFTYQYYFIDRYFTKPALEMDKKFNQFPQDQILNEIKYPYICNYGYHLYPKWRFIPPKPGIECRSMTHHILLARGQGRNSVLSLLKNLSFIQRNTIYGCGIDRYSKESIPQIKFEKIPSEILVELAASRQRMITQKFLEEVDINADGNNI